MSVKDSIEAGILEWLYSTGDKSDVQLSATSNLSLGISGSTPNDTTGAVTLLGSSDRKSIAIATYFSTAAVNGIVNNTADTPLWQPDLGAWGTATHLFLGDPAESTSTCAGIAGVISPNYVTERGIHFRFNTGDITVTITGNFTTICRNNICNLLVRNVEAGNLATLDWGLTTVVPTGTGGDFSEVTGAGYVRARIGPAGLWDAAVGGAPATMSTNAVIEWPVATGSWGNIKGWGLFSTGGTMVAFGDFDTAFDVNADDQPFINAGDLTVGMG